MRQPYSFNFGQPNRRNVMSDYRGGISPHVNLEALRPKLLDNPLPDEEEIDPYEDIMGRYRSVMSEEQPSLQMFRDALTRTPRREDYSPNWKNRLGAALSGFAVGLKDPAQGFATAQHVIEQPYQRALEDYGRDIEGLGQQAELERYDRTNRLKGLEAEVDAIDKNVEMKRKNRETESLIGRRGIQNQRDLASIEDLGSRRTLEGQKFEFDKDIRTRQLEAAGWTQNYDVQGNIIWTNPRTGETLKTGIKSIQGREADQRDRGLRINEGNLNLRGKEFDETRDRNQFNERMDLMNLGQRMQDSNRTPASAFINPTQRRAAEGDVMTELYRLYPAYRDTFMYIDDDGYPNIRQDMAPEELESEEFSEFLQRFNGMVNERLNSVRGQRGGRRFLLEPGQ